MADRNPFTNLYPLSNYNVTAYMKKITLKRWNLISGLILFLAFVISGQYLSHVFTPDHMDELVQRAQIRSNHIYLLLIALLNLLASRIDSKVISPWQGYVDLFWRNFLILAGILLICGFWYEHDGDLLHRQWTRYGLFLTLGAVVVFLLSEWYSDWQSVRKQNHQC